jgi:hypothetical protein
MWVVVITSEAMIVLLAGVELGRRDATVDSLSP